MSTDFTPVSMDTLLLSLKTLESADLFKFMKVALSEAEKKTKQSKTASTTSTTKKTGSMPKGAVPPQLKKPRAWVEYTLKNALENGWEKFTIVQKKKDKEANTTIEEEIEMPASVLHNGSYIYEDSISEKNPNGRQIIHKEAMSLSKQRKEAGHASYTEFEAQYVDESSSDEDSKSESASTTSSKKIVVKKTAAEKEAEKEAKNAQKEAEKEAKKAEKAAAKAQKEAEKAATKTQKETEKKSADLAPAKAVKKAEATPETSPSKTAKKPVTKIEIPNDGMVHPWTYKGKKYLRNFEGETWEVDVDGNIGAWVGLYDSKADKLDTSAPEPVFEDDE